MFDMNSITERKNPLGLIAAFRKAFRRGEDAVLVIKVSRGKDHPVEFARLTHAADRAGAIVIDETTSTRGSLRPDSGLRLLRLPAPLGRVWPNHG